MFHIYVRIIIGPGFRFAHPGYYPAMLAGKAVQANIPMIVDLTNDTNKKL